MSLSDQESLRYSRHLLLEQIGEAGQLSLKNSQVIIVGAGGLGCPAALYLAAAGIGEIIIIDPDQIEVSNLQRQILYKTNHIKRDKVQVAAQQLQALNPNLKVTPIIGKVESIEFAKIITQANAVLDCTDNAQSRYFINQTCQQNRVPLVTAAAIRGEGQFMLFNFKHHKQPCYQCVFPDLMDSDPNIALNCRNSGVLGPVLGIMGSMQALECIKLILNFQPEKPAKLLVFDAWQLSFNQFNLSTDPQCPVCGTAI